MILPQEKRKETFDNVVDVLNKSGTMTIKKQEKEKKTFFHGFRVDLTTEKKLEAIVQEHEVSVAQIVRWALSEYFQKYGTNHRGG